MSSVAARHEIPNSISQQLRQLRARIGRFLFVDGLSRLFAVVILMVLVDVLIDRTFKMDFAQRLIMLCVMAAIVLVVIFLRLLRPSFKRVGDDALILQVEQRHKELQESVISSAQFSREQNIERQGVSRAMVDATIKKGADLAQGIDFRKTINAAAHSRNLALLAAGLIGIGAIGYGVAKTEFWKLWFNRNILLTDDEWPKNTILIIRGARDNRLVLPRGEDYKQFVEVAEESSVLDVEVSIEFDDGNTRSFQKMRKTGKLDGREHLLVFRNLSNEFRFRAKGGDDVTPWVQVRLVEPPGWSELEMKAHLPAYTGVDTETLPNSSGPHSILDGSSLSFSAIANKPLSDAALRLGDQSWPLIKGEGESYTLQIAAADLVGGKYIFDLADASGLRSSRPTSFTLKIKPDRAPNVRATLRGISGLVVSRARVPIAFNATDEFAIENAEFSYVWKGEGSTSVPQTGTVDLGDLDGQLGMREIRSVQVLDLEPLKVPVGVSLRVLVQATDNNTLTGPGLGKSREFLLRVVSEEELRSDLLRREIEQRKAFELALENQEELTVDLKALTALLTDTSQSQDPNQLQSDLLRWQRRQKLVGTNISTVADRFVEFLDEVKNNRLDEAESEIQNTESIEVRFNQRIIGPIRQLDQVEIIQASQQLEVCQRSFDDRDALMQNLQTTTQTQDAIIQEMQRILSAMEDSETYQEVVNKLIEIKRSEEKVRELTREKKQSSGDDIFDDDKANDLFDDDKEDKKTDDKKKKDKKDDGGK